MTKQPKKKTRSLFKRSRKQKRKNGPCHSQYQTLEPRRLMAGDLSNLGSGLGSLVAEFNELQSQPGFGLTTPAFTQATNFFLNQQNVFVEIRTGQQEFSNIQDELNAVGFEEVAASQRDLIIEGFLPVSQLEAISALPTISVNPVLNIETTDSQGSVANEAEEFQFTDFTSRLADLTGAGVKIGVISDSANLVGGGLAASQATGDLPANVKILVPSPLAAPVDEGRAMMELIHDIAPDAELVFASGSGGDLKMADAIRALVADGVDIIVDDLNGLSREPYFQDGLAAQAVDDAVSAGVTYFASNGNRGSSGFNSQTSFETATVAGVSGSWHDFDGNNDFTQAIDVSADGAIFFQFDQAWGSVTSNLDFFLLDAAGNTIISASGNNNPSTQTTQEFVVAPSAGTYQLAVRLTSGAAPSRFQWISIPEAGILEHASVPGAIQTASNPTHNGAVGAIGVAAAYYLSPTVPESFSSSGPVVRTLSPSGAPIPLELRNGAIVTGIDGVNNSFFGGDRDSDGNPNFSGTSAAAPNVAALAALLLEADPSLTPAEIRQSLINGATDITSSGLGFDQTTGAGLVQGVNSLLEVTGGVLTISGDRSGSTTNDTFELSNNSADPLNIIDIDLNGLFLGSVEKSRVRELRLNGIDGDDRFTFQDNFNFDITIDGGNGNDSLVNNAASNGFFVIDAVNGGTFNSSVDFSRIESLTGSNSNDSFTFNAGGSIGAISGGGGNDEIIGPNQNVDWIISGSGAGNTTFINSFAGIEKITGQAGSDEFTLLNSNASNIELVGGGGNDTILGFDEATDWTLSASEQGSIAAKSIAFSELESVVGGSAIDRFFMADGLLDIAIDGGGGSDVLRAPNVARTFRVDGINEGVVEQANLQFARVENLTGGTADDQFVFPNSVSRIDAIIGLDGRDEIVGPNQNVDWNITGSGTGNTAFINFFNGIEQITANAGNDRFLLRNSSAADIELVGGDGVDSVVGFNGVTNWYFTGSKQGNVLAKSVFFSDVEQVLGGSALDRFIMVGNQLDIEVDGGGGRDVLRGFLDNARTFRINGVNLGTVDNANLEFTNIENLTGTAGADQFVFTNDTSRIDTMNGLGGFDTADFSQRGQTNVLLNRSTEAGYIGWATPMARGFAAIDKVIGSDSSNADFFRGTNVASDFVFNPNALSFYRANDRSLIFESFETIVGGDQQDWFGVTAPVDSPIKIIGGQPGSDPGDRIKIELEADKGAGYQYFGPGVGRFLFDGPSVTYFGIEEVLNFDYGDADSIQTLGADNGARHQLGSPLWFGSSLDPEVDGARSSDALADDSLFGDDEDGIFLPANLIPRFRAAAFVSASQAGVLDAWVDFNQDGFFAETERIATGVGLDQGGNRLVFDVPLDAVNGQTASRFRISSTGVASAYGFAADGEVEDHAILIDRPADGSSAVLADPLFHGRTILVMAGTESNNTIVVNPTSDGNLLVKIDGRTTGLYPQSEVDRIGAFGLGGRDTIVVTSTLRNASELYGDAGNDDIFGGAANDYIRGGLGNDRLFGHQGNDLLFGEIGNDSLFGHQGNDLLAGGSGDDRLHGNGATDVLFGGAGSDWLYGNQFNDLLVGNQTNFVNDEVSMVDVQSVWTNVNATPGEKAATLRGASFDLSLGGGITDDGDVDRFFGGNDLDLFADLASNDVLTDFEEGELAFGA